MGRRALNLTGQKFGKLTVKRFHSIQRKQFANHTVSFTLWVVQCDCGSPEKPIKGTSLTSGNTKSCGCARRHFSTNVPHNLDDADHRTQWLERSEVYCKYKYQARKRGLKWALSRSEFEALISGVCHYCGDPPSNRHHGIAYGGIDRKNNSWGYTAENVVSCCKICNLMKHAMSYEDFVAHILKVSHRVSLFLGVTSRPEVEAGLPHQPPSQASALAVGKRVMTEDVVFGLTNKHV